MDMDRFLSKEHLGRLRLLLVPDLDDAGRVSLLHGLAEDEAIHFAGSRRQPRRRLPASDTARPHPAGPRQR